MTNTRRMLPILAFGVMIILSAAFANLLTETDQAPLFVIFLLISIVAFLLIAGARVRRVERSTFVVRRDALGTIDFLDEGTYLYIPYLHKIEAIIPNYAIRHEFYIETIDTRTAKLSRIDKIKVRVVYHLVAPRFCNWFYPSFFEQSQSLQRGGTTNSANDDDTNRNSYYAFIKHRIADFEQSHKLRPEDTDLWPRVLNQVVEAILDDLIRDQVWDWQNVIDADEHLKLERSYTDPPKGENDPYALNLNRRVLAAIIRAEMEAQTHQWGLRIQSIVFEEVEINTKIIDGKTRSKPREIEEAAHQAQIDDITIKGRGLAEAEVRATAVAEIISRLAKERGSDLSDELIYKIVHAALYSDGEMVWNATMEKPKNVNVKAA